MPPTEIPNGIDHWVEREIEDLTRNLWHVVRQSEGDAIADLVDRVHDLAEKRRRGDESAADELKSLIASLSEPEIESLIAAFSIFFDLANLSEDRHRVRVLRRRQLLRGDQPRTESIAAALVRLHETGVGPSQLHAILERLNIELVFTAHPTEAKRKSIREKVRDLREHLAALDQPNLLPGEEARYRQLLVGDLFALWHTDLLRQRKPTVLEEVRRALFFATTLWDVVPLMRDQLTEALRQSYPHEKWTGPLPIRFGSWIGGDRDGHPGVTYEITAETLRITQQAALKLHLEQCRKIRRSLSLSDKQTTISESLRSALNAVIQQWPEVEVLTQPIAPYETCRRFLRVVQWRLEQTRNSPSRNELLAGGYDSPHALADDLQRLLGALDQVPGGEAISIRLRHWLYQLETFGFHLTRLDIRQESTWYTAVVQELMAAAGIAQDYANSNESARQQLLLGTMTRPMKLDAATLSEQARETWSLFLLLIDTIHAGGADALGAQVISMTHAPSDVLVVLWLGRQAAMVRGHDPEAFSMPIAPLLETIDDLRAAEEILDQLLQMDVYRKHVERSGNQIVMVGYSDSTKDGGYLAATWNLYMGQIRLHQATARHGVRLTVFHGRGGALGRGGGPAARGILSLPPRTFDGSLRITEQGEVLAERYDDPAIAMRHLEQVLWAALLVAAHPGLEISVDWQQTMATLAESSLKHYRNLIETPGFIQFFEQATPIREIEQLPIGSRPSRRKSQRSLQSLRAIPWVFSWTQNRCMLPAWYGMGTAIEQLRQDNPKAIELLGEMYREWPFFQATISNAELALAKADMGIAQQYAFLVDDPEIGSAIWNQIESEYFATRRAVLAITGSDDLLGTVPWLKRSISVRNPYVDPLNFIQMELMRRTAAEDDSEQTEVWHQLARLTVQAISGGLRTTG